MKARISLTGLLAAIMLFAVGVAMHEAARADHLTGQTSSPLETQAATAIPTGSAS